MEAQLQKYILNEAATLHAAQCEFAKPTDSGQRRRTCLAIVSAPGDRLIGVVSERDVVRAVLDGLLPTSPVESFMVRAERLSVVTAERFVGTDPLTLSCVMARSGFKHLPIVASVADPRIIGVLDSVAVAAQLSAASRAAGALVVSLAAAQKHVLVVQEGDSVATASRRMLADKTTAAVVRRAGESHARAFGGLVTLADVLRKCPDASTWATTPVRAICTPKTACITVNRNALKGAGDYLGVLRTMATRAFRHMPVVSTVAVKGTGGRRHTLIVADDMLDILSCNSLLTAALPPPPEGLIASLLPPLPSLPTMPSLMGDKDVDDTASVAGSSIVDDVRIAGSSVARPLSHAANAATSAAGTAVTACNAAQEDTAANAAIRINALDWKKLADVRAAYGAVENGRKPTDREKKRLEICMAKMVLLIDELQTRCDGHASADGGDAALLSSLTLTDIQLFAGSLSLCATAARAAATWGYLLGCSASEFYGGLTEASTWLGKLKGVYAAGARSGVIELDSAGYPNAPVGALPLGGILRFAKGASEDVVAVSLAPRFATACLLEQYTGFLRYYLADATATVAAPVDASHCAGEPTQSSGSETEVAPLEARTFALTSIHAWLARGQACVDIDALALAVIDGTDSSSGSDTISDVVDAVNRVSDVAALAEELMLSAFPAAAWIAFPAVAPSTPSLRSNAWSASAMLNAVEALSASEGSRGPRFPATEALDHVAMYVDVQRALAPLLRAGVCCEPLPTPLAVTMAWSGRNQQSGSSTLPPLTLRPIGLSGAAAAAQCLLAIRAASAVFQRVPMGVKLAAACVAHGLENGENVGTGVSAATAVLASFRGAAAVDGCVASAIGGAGSPRTPLLYAASWIEDSITAACAHIGQIDAWASLGGTAPEHSALQVMIGTLAVLAAAAAAIAEEASEDEAVCVRARMKAAIASARSTAGVGALRLCYGRETAHAVTYLLAPMDRVNVNAYPGACVAAAAASARSMFPALAAPLLAQYAPLAANIMEVAALQVELCNTAVAAGKDLAGNGQAAERCPLTLRN